MRLTILGGGGFRVPLVHRALIEDMATGDGVVDEVVLVDHDGSRLAAVMAVLDHQHRAAGRPPVAVRAVAVRAVAEVDEALRGADVVFSAIRVGGLAGRVTDERIARREGVIGQETVGAGGISYGLRTVPVVHRLAERIAAVAGQAWVVNFTNPAGVVTEVMSRTLGDRVIGICDSPVGLGRRAARALAADPDQVRLDYAGLNHLGWLRGLYVGSDEGGSDQGELDRLPELLESRSALESFEEGALFGARWLQALGAIPNEYLHYYYFDREARAAAAAAPGTRGEVIIRQQEEFYRSAAADPDRAFELWEAARRAREATYMAENRQAANLGADAAVGERSDVDLDGGGYTAVALAVMRAITRGETARLILNVRNQGALPGVAGDSVVEVPCLVGGDGARPIAARQLDADQAALVQAVKAVEVETIAAALSGSRRAALRAFAGHPLVDSVAVAGRLLDAYLDEVPGLADILHGR